MLVPGITGQSSIVASVATLQQRGRAVYRLTERCWLHRAEITADVVELAITAKHVQDTTDNTTDDSPSKLGSQHREESLLHGMG